VYQHRNSDDRNDVTEQAVKATERVVGKFCHVRRNAIVRATPVATIPARTINAASREGIVRLAAKIAGNLACRASSAIIFAFARGLNTGTAQVILTRDQTARDET
jgi:hypothetical protein